MLTKLYSGHGTWEMRLKCRTQCTVTTSSVATSLVHSRDGELLGSLSKRQHLAKCMGFCLAAEKELVAFGCDRCQLWGASLYLCFAKENCKETEI